ncbi:MAG: hypothetical protein Q9180_002583, partial [Flavoplaca navasiana]
FGKHFGSRNARKQAAEPDGGQILSTPQGFRVDIDTEAEDLSNRLSHRDSTAASLESSRNRSPAARDPLGLHVVHSPKENRKLDIVFVHGLGGTSRLSWSKNKDLSKFWPSKFLPLETEICHARILTFGYNANIVRDASNRSSSVLDFAKELLFELRFAKDDNTEDLDIGTAFLQGQNDPEYERIIRMVSAILFLSTPHRGTNLAETLNRILQALFIATPKQFIGDLARNSFALQKMNDQFRHIAPKLDIVSFYETQMTPIGLQRNKVMVLEKESSVLGYPGEISKALNADHHGVCKYESPQDPIYVTVRNVLKSLIRKLSMPSSSNEATATLEDERFDAEYALGITEAPDTDYSFFRGRWAVGTCHWILENPTFLDWEYDNSLSPRALWLHGSAASGKSVLASFVINHLVESHRLCQYFFIRFGDQAKRSASTLLRSLALQIAAAVPAFRQKLIQKSEDVARLKSADVQSIWQKLFKSMLFRISMSQPLYWVIDGLEESHSPRTILKMLADVLLAPVPIRILIISRKTQDITSAFWKAFDGLHLDVLANEGHQRDFHHFIDQELQIPDPKFKGEVSNTILESARGNFLWVHLAIQKINKCMTKADVKKAFEQLPPGMDALYGRMAQSVANIVENTNRQRAHDILAWVACASRALDVRELCQALETEAEEIIDLPKSIENFCGGFVVVDSDGQVAMIHQTAREYLLGPEVRPFNIDKRAHEQLFIRCMMGLTENGLRAKVNRGQESAFMHYSMASWFRHVLEAFPLSSDAMSILMKFARGSSMLVWIQALASNEHLRTLVTASTYLSKFAEKLRHADLDVVPTDRQIPEREIIEKWSMDLVKIVGKFGGNLTRNPEAIHRLIPPFCPHDSILYQQYGRKEIRSLMVGGFTNTSWDDSLARLSFSSGIHADRIVAVGAYIFVLDPAGNIYIYGEKSFEEIHQLKHGERIRWMHVNSNGTLLVAYGFNSTSLWDVADGRCIGSVRNPTRSARPQSMNFVEDDTTIMLGSDDGRLRLWRLSEPLPEWKIIAELDEQRLEGTFVNSPSCMSISPDGNQIALGYRGHPASVWEIQGPELIGHCSRRDAENAWGEVIQITWHPYSGEVLGLYLEGIVFKWNPYDYDVEEIRTGGAKLVVSQDGNFFATGDATGNLKVFSITDFCLVYQLAAQDPVLDISFSPDSHRLYDIRGSFGNVWEPSALLKYSETTERSSDDASDSQSIASRMVVSGVQSQNIDTITSLATHPNGRYYCIGTEDGTTELFDVSGGKIGNLGSSRSYMTTEQIVWSPNGRYIAIADLSGRLHVKTFQPRSDAVGSWATESKLEMPIGMARGAILQLLFHADSTRIFVYTSTTISVIMVSTKAVHASVVLSPPYQSFRWVNHPLEQDTLIAVGPGIIQTRAWDDLRENETIHTVTPFVEQVANLSLISNDETELEASQSELEKSMRDYHPVGSWKAQESVDRVFLTPGEKYLLVQTSYPIDRSRHRHKQVILFEVAALRSAQAACRTFEEIDASGSNFRLQNTSQQRMIDCITLPEHLACDIEVPLAFLSRDRLVFLDRNFWVCSWRLPLPSNILARSTSETAVTTGGGSNMSATLAGRRASETTLSGGGSTNIRRHFFLPGDWISPDCVTLCTVASDGTVLCPRNGEVAVIKCATLRN